MVNNPSAFWTRQCVESLVDRQHARRLAIILIKVVVLPRAVILLKQIGLLARDKETHIK